MRDPQLAGQQPKRPMRAGQIMARTAVVLAALLTAAAMIGVPAASAHPVQGRSDSSVTPQVSSPQNAIARTSTNLTGAVTPAASCPASGSICYYDSRNFGNLLGWDTPSSCSGTYLLDPLQNKIESIRNRTGCKVFLLYYCGSNFCYNEWMRPHSEDGTINPLNAIDAIRLASG